VGQIRDSTPARVLGVLALPASLPTRCRRGRRSARSARSEARPMVMTMVAYAGREWRMVSSRRVVVNGTAPLTWPGDETAFSGRVRTGRIYLGI
jgi:hypothetical protein